MNIELPFFNLSLRRLLATEPLSFNRAKIKILFTILIFSLSKVLLVLAVALPNGQSFQSGRALVLLAVYLILLKLLLYKRTYLKPITHTMILVGLLVIWSTVFISAQGINIIIIQFVFMVMLSSFYLLERRFGLWYSILAFTPVCIFLAGLNNESLNLQISADVLAAPGGLLLVILNFLTVLVSHYLYHEAFSANLYEKVSLNQQLESSVKEANELARTKSDFLSVMSHELRTPLNSVIGMTELLLDEPADKQQEDNLKVLRFSALSLHTLINDILDFNKLDSNKIELESISVNLPELIRNICSGLEIQANEKGLRLISEVDPSLAKINVISDPTRLSQIIYNLLGNGIKFTNNGFVKIILRKLFEDSGSVRVLFIVEDSGIGINPDKHQVIFEPFTQASTTTTRNFGGTGLGLSIVKRMLKLFKSDIHLKSSEGNGSSFFFELEFKLDPIPLHKKKAVLNESADLSGLRVMIAEDNPMNVFLVRKLCNKWNIQPVVADNGQDAVEKLKADDFDLILMDIHMPLKNGFDAAREIRSLQDPKKSNVHIIAITASVSQDLAEKVRESGMNDAISKPFDHRDLFEKLASVKAAVLL